MKKPVRAITPHSAPIPHPPFRMPFIGDIFTVDFVKPAQALARQACELGGIFEQRVFGHPAIIISDTSLIDELNDEKVWEKHVGHVIRKLRPIGGDGLFTAYNDEPNWSKAHNILMPAFTRAAMLNYHDSIIHTVQELINTWNIGPAGRGWIDIPGEANRLTIEVISRAGFGYAFNKLSDESVGPFIAAVLRELRYANRRTDVLPRYEQLFMRKRRRQHYEDKRYIRQQVDKIVEARKRQPRSNERRDMLDIMLQSTDPDTGENLDDANVANQILTLLVAGSETSANTIAFALHYLSANPDICARARQEIDERWPNRSLPDIQFDEVAKLRYLRRIVDETLRLWPVAPGYFRQAKRDTALGGGKYRFKAKDWVFVLLLAAHRDPAWGPDAEKFNPDRFLAENLRKLPPRTYKPFGTGPRSCIGRQFALHEVLVTLAMILHQYHLEPDTGYQLQVSETITLKPEQLRLRVHPR
ncbi:cytochrome P450 [Mycobacterium sp. 1245852.3]|uniref:cytochrome P450 n=1 Tax=Mycobacterium sp. 1245852.3 TaxID=1856860 RepID=UPI0009EEBCE9|nr:cytochrome P450 [Mycobacterium sp. 1245852.3]